MRYLRLRKLRGVSMRELLRAENSGIAKGLIGLTFDDGFEDFLQTALPVLERFGFSATVFTIGRLPRVTTWDPYPDPRPQIKRLGAEGIREVSARGMEVGSHSMNHLRLSGLEPELLEEEVSGSRRVLSEVLGEAVEGFCYPYGSIDSAAVQAVRRAGYAYACATTERIERNVYDLPRMPVAERDHLWRFAAKLEIFSQDRVFTTLETHSPHANSAEENRYDAYVSRIARGAGISSFGQGLGRVLAYITQIVLARMYGPAQLGFYALGTTIVGIANILAEFGMNRAVVGYGAQYHADRDVSRQRGIMLLALGVTFALSLALSILMFLGAGFLAGEVFSKPPLETPFKAFSIAVPFFTLMSMSLWATESFQTVKYTAIVKGVWQPVVNIVLIVAFYVLGHQVLGAVAAYVVSMIAGSALALYYLQGLFPQLLDRNTPSVFESRAAFKVSRQAWISQMAEYANVWVAVIVLGIYATGEAVGIYNAAARTAAFSGIIYMAFSGIFSPMISSLYGRGLLLELSYLYKDVSRWIFSAGLVVFLLMLLLSKDILAVFGDEFVSGWVVMIILAGAYFFNCSIGATNRVLIMTRHQHIYTLAMIGALLTSLVMSFTLIPVYGMIGAAWATAGSAVLSNLFTLGAIRKVMNLWPYSRGYLKSLIAGLLAAAIVFVVRWLLPLPDGLSAILALAPLFLVGFAVMLLGLGLSPSDRQFLKAVWMAARRTAQRGA